MVGIVILTLVCIILFLFSFISVVVYGEPYCSIIFSTSCICIMLYNEFLIFLERRYHNEK